MHCALRMVFPDGGEERIVSVSEMTHRPVEKLAEVLGLGGSLEWVDGGIGDAGVVVSDSEPGVGYELCNGMMGNLAAQGFWNRRNDRFYILIYPMIDHIAPAKMLRRIMYLAMLRRVMHGASLMVHGALLEIAAGAVGLFGASGIGKSSAAARYEKQGGSVLCDDMFLVTMNGDGFFGMPVPTWSRLSYPEFKVDFNRRKRMCGLLHLTRGIGDRIEADDRNEWRNELTAAATEFVYKPSRCWLPPELRGRAVRRILDKLPQICRRFGEYRLSGDLRGEICASIEHYALYYREFCIS